MCLDLEKKAVLEGVIWHSILEFEILVEEFDLNLYSFWFRVSEAALLRLLPAELATPLLL
ncbi:hypothetical protein OIU78_004475 [Salix suchowensis]|nr:hypothetical protein OIU78_004475 [Salix suchowensis]